MALSWFGKRFGPGDIDGAGALKLLGTPNMGVAATLVRETAQNSWDARSSARPVRYEIHVRTLRGPAVRALRKEVFSEAGDGQTLAHTLEKAEIPVIEIVDRGTHGLGGPVRNDLAIPDGESTDFIDFVMTIGARQDKERGAGTYGFGKTIAYLASSAHTILVWSRCKYRGKLESRLIGSAMGDSFSVGRARFTGRQWWGSLKDNRVEPVKNRSADAIAAKLFQSTFSKSETGTSLLIIDPVDVSGGMGTDWAEGWAEQCRQAVLWHLWPKLVPHPGTGRLPMQIRMTLEGRKYEIGDPLSHPVLSGFADSLNAIRSAQDGALDFRADDLTTISPIEIYRPVDTLGHLAVTRVPSVGSAVAAPANDFDDDGKAVGPVDEVAPFKGPARHVALMRHDAELVVKYLDLGGSISETVHACGVFRCSEHLDDLFASAEPPAHDLWEPGFIQDRTRKSLVNTALKRIPRAWAEQLAPDLVETVDAGEAISEGYLSAALAGLLPGVAGPGPGPTTTSGSSSGDGGGRRRRRASLTVGAATAVTRPDGLRLVAVPFSVDLNGPSMVEIVAGAATEGGGTEGGIDGLSVLGFVRGQGAADSERVTPEVEGPTLQLTVGSDTYWTALLTHPTWCALSVLFKVEDQRPQ